MSGTGMGHLADPYALAQRYEDKKNRMQEVIKNKEAALLERHKRMREQFLSQQKLDKEKMKKQKEAAAKRQYIIGKNQEKMMQAA